MSAISSLPPGAQTPFLGLDVGNTPNAKLEDVAKQVEGLFVSMLLKTMRETMASEMFAGDGADVWGSVFDQSMGEQIATGGGMGLVEQLQPRQLNIAA